MGELPEIDANCYLEKKQKLKQLILKQNHPHINKQSNGSSLFEKNQKRLLGINNRALSVAYNLTCSALFPFISAIYELKH